MMARQGDDERRYAELTRHIGHDVAITRAGGEVTGFRCATCGIEITGATEFDMRVAQVMMPDDDNVLRMPESEYHQWIAKVREQIAKVQSTDLSCGSAAEAKANRGAADGLENAADEATAIAPDPLPEDLALMVELMRVTARSLRASADRYDQRRRRLRSAE